MTDQELSKEILECAFRVHTILGPGLLESAYQACLSYELVNNGFKVEAEKPLPLIYNEVKLDCGYRIDLFVEDKLIIELKSIDEIAPIHLAQVLTYLKLSKIRFGLLINFNVKSLKDGIKRVVNGY
ncbi:MAG: GxxExxY protein [Saprospiraceae bacterium]|nr:GxxExxY protein [Saprospiraceae bacterium]